MDSALSPISTNTDSPRARPSRLSRLHESKQLAVSSARRKDSVRFATGRSARGCSRRHVALFGFVFGLVVDGFRLCAGVLVATRERALGSAKLAEPSAVGKVARIVFDQLRDQLEVTLCERHIDLASGRIFGEVAGRRQAPIQCKGLRGARLIARLIEQVTQSPSR